MNIFIFLSIFSTVISLGSSFHLLRKLKNTSAIYFLFTSISACLWFLFYALFFSGIASEPLLLFITRFSYAIGVVGSFSFLGFVFTFGEIGFSSLKKHALILLGIISITFHYYIGTDYIIAGLKLSGLENIFREIPGEYYFLHILYYLTYFIVLFYIGGKRLKYQTTLNRVRLKYILFTASGSLFFIVLFQLILPIFGIWVFEKEIVLFFVFFVIQVRLIVDRYYFSSISYDIGKIVSFALGISITLIMLGIIRYLYGDTRSTITSYWGFNENFYFIDIILGIFIFLPISQYLDHRILGKRQGDILKYNLLELEKVISSITGLEELNQIVAKGLKRSLRTKYCEMIYYDKNNVFPNELVRFFQKSNEKKVFINDFVFIEENKNSFNPKIILSEIPKNTFIILPFFNRKGDNIGGLFLGVKIMGEFYQKDEIDALRQFVFFLELHLKYIQTYEKIQEYSMNLDKKVDEKTIEYNDLINKQKEFISVISHEIKSPIASAIFQADSILDDIDAGKNSVEYLRSEVSLLNTQLIKTGELLSKLFSVQYYDTHSVTLFREKVQIARLLETECEICAKMNEQIQFITRIDRSMGFIELDRIQFQQVIDNILQNAVKFSCPKNPIITVEASIQKGKLTIIIEDNGRGFEGIDVQKLFDKYATGGGVSAGLGMGLYLCKRIVEMHGGVIEATGGANGIGARFTIYIPVYS